MGRTDGDIAKGSASLTGFDFTTLGSLFARAGLTFGMNVYKDKNGGRYFSQSDNVSFARFGVPDNTICTAFEFPDYHGLKDEWPKINLLHLDGYSRPRCGHGRLVCCQFKNAAGLERGSF